MLFVATPAKSCFTFQSRIDCVTVKAHITRSDGDDSRHHLFYTFSEISISEDVTFSNENNFTENLYRKGNDWTCHQDRLHIAKGDSQGKLSEIFEPLVSFLKSSYILCIVALGRLIMN